MDVKIVSSVTQTENQWCSQISNRTPMLMVMRVDFGFILFFLNSLTSKALDLG